jgi:cephalosporin-C deacetylase-like acetyl esterase
MGGELVIRAAAFERRLAAVVADPGILNLWLNFQTSYPPLASLFADGAAKEQVNAAFQHEIVPKLTVVDRYNLAKRSEVYGGQFLLDARAGKVFTDLYDLGRLAEQFSVSGVVHRVSTPTLVTTYQYDQYVLPSQGFEVYERLSSRKQYHHFTATEHAQYHCAPMAPQTRNQVVFDWLDSTL